MGYICYFRNSNQISFKICKFFRRFFEHTEKFSKSAKADIKINAQVLLEQILDRAHFCGETIEFIYFCIPGFEIFLSRYFCEFIRRSYCPRTVQKGQFSDLTLFALVFVITRTVQRNCMLEHLRCIVVLVVGGISLK